MFKRRCEIKDREYQEILERIHDLETLPDEEIIEKFGLVEEDDYWIEEQLEDLPKIYEFLKQEKEGTLETVPIEELYKEFNL